MKKELNPELFLDRPVKTIPQQTNSHLLDTDKQIYELRQSSERLNDDLDHLSVKFMEHINQEQSKLDRLGLAVNRLEVSHNGLASEISAKLNLVQNKLAERKSVDDKIQEMMDRHNNVIKGFEVRVNQLQKLIAAKEAQLLSTQTVLNETKIEIARLKRL